MPIDATLFPLSAYFLSGYLSKREDETNFPKDGGTALFERYERLFALGIAALGVSKEQLRNRSEFNFDSGDAANMEGGLGMLRVAQLLHLNEFTNITLVNPGKRLQGADLVATKNEITVCVEVKTITKQSHGRGGFFFDDQLYEKVREFATKAATQLKTSAEALHCEVTLLACVVNWFDQTIYLTLADYQRIVNRLELDGYVRSTDGIDVVWFVMKFGNEYAFLNENGKRIEPLGLVRNAVEE